MSPNAGHNAIQKRKRCWFADVLGPDIGPCDGRLVKCHLLPRRLLKRESLEKLTWDPRIWVWGCGGVTGCAGHHGALDHARTLRVPRSMVPAELEAFAAEHGLSWWLDREYGPLAQAA